MRTLALLLLVSHALAETTVICGPATLPFNGTTLAKGVFYRLARCGYTLAPTASLNQAFTLTNPAGALLKVYSARDTACEALVTTTPPAGDNAWGVSTSSKSLQVATPYVTATGDSSGEPRVCVIATCVTGSCNGVGLALTNYYGRRSTCSAGQSWTGATCTTCPANTWPSGGPSLSCTPCQSGYVRRAHLYKN